MKRYLKLSKYRNLGMDKEDTLVLNNCLEKGKMGDLVLVIGSNNSGKSNVLDALKNVRPNGTLTDRDVSTLSFEQKDLNPVVSFCVKDDDFSASYEIKKSGASCSASFPKQPEINFVYEDALKEFEQWSKIAANYYYYGNPFPSYLQRLQREEAKNQKVFLSAVDSCLNQYKQNIGEQTYNNFVNQITKIPGNLKHLVPSIDSPLAKANSYMNHTYGIDFLPNIISYADVPITSKDLSVPVSDLDSSSFFQSIFKAIGIQPEYIKNGYKQYQTFHNIASLSKMKKEVSNKISALNDEFNRMYFAESDKYVFSLVLEDSRLSFGMARGKDEDPVMIDYQSTGFRWFFDLFFNFLSTNKIKAGDIVVMDEPGTNLHPKGQQELRRFLKEFAVRNDLTFVIATHSPFLLDPDNYDELRIVEMENNRAKIDNLFTAVDVDDPDSLKPIKESLTIEQNVLYGYGMNVIWVEGITDYNYLTMFKRFLGYKDISFLPFQGVGTSPEKTKQILEALIKINFPKRKILVDGDKAGIAMQKACQETAFKDTMLVSDPFDADSGIKEIEDLFSEEDRKKYGCLNEKDKGHFKKAADSSILKKTCKKEDFSPKTIENFKKLFDALYD